jgi:isopentenyl-diphosphate delta-isomerase
MSLEPDAAAARRPSAPVARISERKLEHLRLSLEASVQSQRSAGFDRWSLPHRALPELDLDAVDTGTTFLSRRVRLPFLISGMTGGAHQAADINRRLARAAQAAGVAFGVGSQRAGLSHRDLRATYQVRSVAPDVLLLANLGAVQLNYGLGPAECLEAVEMIEADALVLHLNPLQEALQPEGDHNFTGLLDRISAVTRELPVPVIVKEVGCGISGEVAAQLASAGVAAIDVAGLGGTSFARVEAFRREKAEEVELALAFSEWGIATAEALVDVRRAVPQLPLIASGGLRHGLDAAKALAMGASLCGFGQPLLAAAHDSEAAVRTVIDGFAWQLRVAMFCVGAKDVAELESVPVARLDPPAAEGFR